MKCLSIANTISTNPTMSSSRKINASSDTVNRFAVDVSKLPKFRKRRTTYNPNWRGSSDEDGCPCANIGDSDEEFFIRYPQSWHHANRPSDPKPALGDIPTASVSQALKESDVSAFHNRVAVDVSKLPKFRDRCTTYKPNWRGSSDEDDCPWAYIGDSDEELVITYPSSWRRFNQTPEPEPMAMCDVSLVTVPEIVFQVSKEFDSTSPVPEVSGTSIAAPFAKPNIKTKDEGVAGPDSDGMELIDSPPVLDAADTWFSAETSNAPLADLTSMKPPKLMKATDDTDYYADIEDYEMNDVESVATFHEATFWEPDADFDVPLRFLGDQTFDASVLPNIDSEMDGDQPEEVSSVSTDEETSSMHDNDLSSLFMYWLEAPLTATGPCQYAPLLDVGSK